MGGGLSVESDLRASLVVGAVAAGLSLLVGLLSRVDFLPLLVRALVFGIVFGGLGWAVLYFLRRYLPDLFDDGARSSAEPAGFETEAADGGGGETGSVLGSEVDIVLGPDDDEALLATGGEHGSGREGTASPARAGRGPAVGAEVEDAEDVDMEDDGAPSLIEPAVRSVESAPMGAAMPARASMGVDELDILPDLDSLSESFVGAGGDHDTGSSFASTESGSNESRGRTGGTGAGADPAALALAVRTLLKRDQKG